MEEKLLKLKKEILQALQADTDRSHKAERDLEDKYNETNRFMFRSAAAEARGSAIAYSVAQMHVEDAFCSALKEL